MWPTSNTKFNLPAFRAEDTRKGKVGNMIHDRVLNQTVLTMGSHKHCHTNARTVACRRKLLPLSIRFSMLGLCLRSSFWFGKDEDYSVLPHFEAQEEAKRKLCPELNSFSPSLPSPAKSPLRPFPPKKSHFMQLSALENFLILLRSHPRAFLTGITVCLSTTCSWIWQMDCTFLAPMWALQKQGRWEKSLRSSKNQVLF